MLAPARLAELLHPFLSATLSPSQLQSISIYIDLLLHWNARINLTAIRQPENIVTRHFGESLFAARQLFPATHVGTAALGCPAGQSPAASPNDQRPTTDLIDLGSGAGFPGLPIKIWNPNLQVTLIESNHKKVAFLREVIRAITLTGVDVFAGRAEDFSARAAVVTLRAVERFEAAVPFAADLMTPSARLALLVGETQVDLAKRLAPTLVWRGPMKVPQSSNRVLLVGSP